MKKIQYKNNYLFLKGFKMKNFKDFEIGNIVMIMKSATPKKYRKKTPALGWADIMDDMVGNIYTIEAYYLTPADAVRRLNNGYLWYTEDLKLIIEDKECKQKQLSLF